MRSAHNYRIRTGELPDASIVARDIRALDILDIRAASALNPEEATLRSFAASHRRFAFDWNEKCVAIGGIQFDAANALDGSIWLIGTPSFDEAMRTGGLRYSRSALRSLARGTNRLYNYVDASNIRTRRWLRWIGFTEKKVHLNFRNLGHDCVEVVYHQREI